MFIGTAVNCNVSVIVIFCRDCDVCDVYVIIFLANVICLCNILILKSFILILS